MTRQGHVHHVRPQCLHRSSRPAPDKRQQSDQDGEACCVRVHELPELPDPLTALRRQAQLGPPRHHHTPLKSEEPLMDQCSTARHPISATGIPTNWPAHGLTLGIKIPAAGSAHRPAARNQPLTTGHHPLAAVRDKLGELRGSSRPSSHAVHLVATVVTQQMPSPPSDTPNEANESATN